LKKKKNAPGFSLIFSRRRKRLWLPADSKFKRRFRQSLEDTERKKRTSYFFVIFFRGIRVEEEEEVSFLFNTRVSVGAKVVGFNFGSFAAEELCWRGIFIVLEKQVEEEESPRCAKYYKFCFT
jgi:hypothetical protein